MKKSLLPITLLLMLTMISNAQNSFPSTGSAGIGTTAPNASALLDIRSTVKGVLIPRMTRAQRDFIAAPATGLLIYQTDNGPAFYWYTGSAWNSLDDAAKDLSDLSATPSINRSLLPVVGGTIDLEIANQTQLSAYLTELITRSSGHRI